MITFFGNAALKEEIISRLKAHAKADAIVRGRGYWDGHRGCAVGCTLSYPGQLTAGSAGRTFKTPHSLYPTQLGLPVWLAHVEDAVFETLPPFEFEKFPLQFIRAIPVGITEARLERVRDDCRLFWVSKSRAAVVGAPDRSLFLVDRTIKALKAKKIPYELHDDLFREAIVAADTLRRRLCKPYEHALSDALWAAYDAISALDGDGVDRDNVFTFGLHRNCDEDIVVARRNYLLRKLKECK